MRPANDLLGLSTCFKYKYITILLPRNLTCYVFKQSILPNRDMSLSSKFFEQSKEKRDKTLIYNTHTLHDH